MNCVHCDGKYKEKFEDYTVELRDGMRVTVFHMSLLECDKCRDQVIPPKSGRMIEERIREVYPNYYKKSDVRLELSNHIRVIEEQNRTLKLLLKSIATILPRHSDNCASYSSHPSYGDKYCNCSMKEIKSEIENFLNE